MSILFYVMAVWAGIVTLIIIANEEIEPYARVAAVLQYSLLVYLLVYAGMRL